MENRFKFRAWNLEKGIMHYDVEDTYDGISNNAIEHSNFSAVLEDNEYIVMQCTGLKDKNGKLIYEGDILKTDLKRPYNIVVFRNGMFMVECEHTTGIYYDLFCGVCDDLKKDIDSCNYEIIGNIYENKELLEEKK